MVIGSRSGSSIDLTRQSIARSVCHYYVDSNLKSILYNTLWNRIMAANNETAILTAAATLFHICREIMPPEHPPFIPQLATSLKRTTAAEWSARIGTQQCCSDAQKRQRTSVSVSQPDDSEVTETDEDVPERINIPPSVCDPFVQCSRYQANDSSRVLPNGQFITGYYDTVSHLTKKYTPTALRDMCSQHGMYNLPVKKRAIAKLLVDHLGKAAHNDIDLYNGRP